MRQWHAAPMQVQFIYSHRGVCDINVCGHQKIKNKKIITFSREELFFSSVKKKKIFSSLRGTHTKKKESKIIQTDAVSVFSFPHIHPFCKTLTRSALVFAMRALKTNGQVQICCQYHRRTRLFFFGCMCGGQYVSKCTVWIFSRFIPNEAYDTPNERYVTPNEPRDTWK